MRDAMELDKAFLQATDVDSAVESCAMNQAWIKRSLYMNLLPILGPTAVFFKDFYFAIF